VREPIFRLKEFLSLFALALVTLIVPFFLNVLFDIPLGRGVIVVFVVAYPIYWHLTSAKRAEMRKAEARIYFLAALARKKSPNRSVIYSVRVFAACLIAFYCVYFLGLMTIPKHLAIFLGFISAGIFSIFAAYYYHCTKEPLANIHAELPFDFNTEPGQYKLALLAMVVFGVLCMFVGAFVYL